MITYKRTIDETTKKLKDNVYIIKDVPISEDDIFINVSSTVPLTHIAEMYYGDINLWKYIASINNIKGMYAPEGTILRIPLNSEISFERD